MMATLHTRALTTLGNVKDQLNIDVADTTQDDHLTRLINTATIAIENYCKRKLKSSTLTETHYGPMKNLFPETFPITAINYIRDNDGNDLIVNTDYTNRDSYIALTSEQKGPLEIQYIGGYDPIPEDLDMACVLLVEYYHKTGPANFSTVFGEGGVVMRPRAMPPHARVLLDAYRKLVV